MDVANTAGTFLLTPRVSNPNGERGSALFVLSYPDLGTAQISGFNLPNGYPVSPCCLEHPFYLRIYHFNDLHGHLAWFTGKDDLAVMSRMVWKVKQNRQEWLGKKDRAVLFISSGDNCDGSIYDDLISRPGLTQQVSSYYSLFSNMGLDAGGIGNHDFNPGFHRLMQSIEEDADFPVFAANLSLPGNTQPPIYPAGVLIVNGLRVGFIGVTTRAETHLDPHTATILDPIRAIKSLIPLLRPICDVLIAITHLGYCLEHSSVPMADAGDVQLAASLSEGSVDLIVGGHSHSVLNGEGFQAKNRINGIPIVQAGSNGEYLGQVDFQISNGSVSLQAARLWSVSELNVDQEFESVFLDPIETNAHTLREKVLGSVGADLWRQKQSIIEGFSKGEEALANFLADAMLERLDIRGYAIDFAMLDSSALHSGLPESNILTYGDCFKLMPYLDHIVIYTMTAAQVHELLNDNARRFSIPGEDLQEKGFLQFSEQLRYRLNRGKNPTDSFADSIRIKQIALQDLKDHTFKIGTTSFTREAACAWERHQDGNLLRCLFNLAAYPRQDTGLIFRHEIISYIEEQGGITQASGARKDGRVAVNPPWED